MIVEMEQNDEILKLHPPVTYSISFAFNHSLFPSHIICCNKKARFSGGKQKFYKDFLLSREKV
jgi:hypothetical protein